MSLFQQHSAFPSEASLASLTEAPAYIRRGLSALRWDLAALGLVVLVGLAVRLHGLTAYGIWFDEGYHIELVKLPTTGAMLAAVLSNPPSDPLYALVLRGWAVLFGHGDAAVRGLSVLIGILTLPAIYRLGISLGSRSAGVLGAALFAVSPYALEFGQEAALYGLAALLATLAISQGIAFLATGRGGVLYVLLGVAAVYSHYVVAVILALLVLLSLVPGVKHAASLKSWFAMNLLVFALWTPWLALMLLHWAASDLPRPSLVHRAAPAELLGALVQYSSGTAALQVSNGVLEALGLMSGGLLLAFAVICRAKAGRLFRPLILGAGLVFAVPWLASRLSGNWLFVPHFMLFLLPVLMGVMGYAVLLAAARWRGLLRLLALSGLAVWLGVQVSGLSLFYRFPPHGADGLRQLALVLTQQEPGGPVFVTPPLLAAALQQYYGGPVHGLPSDFDLRRVYLPYNPSDWDAACLQRLSSLVYGQIEFSLVYRPELDKDGQFLAALQHTYTQLEHRAYPYADLYRFAVKPGAEGLSMDAR